MKTIKAFYTLLIATCLLSLASAQAMEKEVIKREVKPLTEIIFDYLVKLYDVESNDQNKANKAIDPRLIQLLYDSKGHIVRLPAEITQKFLAYAEQEYPNLFNLGLPPKIVLSGKNFFSQDGTVFFSPIVNGTLFLHAYHQTDKILGRISFNNNVEIVEIKPAQGPMSKQENSFYVLAAVHGSNPHKELSEQYRIAYKINLDGIQSSQEFPAYEDLQTIQDKQEQVRNLSSCSFASLLAYLIARKHPALGFDIQQAIITIVYSQGNSALNAALNRILFPKKQKALNLYHEHKHDEGSWCTIS